MGRNTLSNTQKGKSQMMLYNLGAILRVGSGGFIYKLVMACAMFLDYFGWII